MQARWYADLPLNEQEEFKRRLLQVQDVLDRMDTVLSIVEDSKEIAREADYNSASWAYKQADINGYIRAIREVRGLLKLTT